MSFCFVNKYFINSGNILSVVSFLQWIHFEGLCFILYQEIEENLAQQNVIN